MSDNEQRSIEFYSAAELAAHQMFRFAFGDSLDAIRRECTRSGVEALANMMFALSCNISASADDAVVMWREVNPHLRVNHEMIRLVLEQRDRLTRDRSYFLELKVRLKIANDAQDVERLH